MKLEILFFVGNPITTYPSFVNNLFNSYDKSVESDPILPGYISENYYSAEIPYDSLRTTEEQYLYMSHALKVNAELSKMSH